MLAPFHPVTGEARLLVMRVSGTLSSALTGGTIKEQRARRLALVPQPPLIGFSPPVRRV